MQTISLLVLRISIGLLLVIWGADKIVDLEHAVAVSNKVYYGAFSGPVMQSLLTVVGALEISLGIAVIVGVFRHIAYIFLALVTGTTLVAVSGSVIDPWGWFLENSNVLFYPSLIIFAGVLVLFAFREADTCSIDNALN